MAGPGHNRRGGDKPASGRVRSMTLYDRLEDARERRKAALAGKSGEDTKPAPPPTTPPPSDPAPPRKTPTPAADPEIIPPRPRRNRLLLWLIATLIVAGGLFLAYGPDGRSDTATIAATPPTDSQAQTEAPKPEPAPEAPALTEHTPPQLPETVAPLIAAPANPGRAPERPATLQPYKVLWSPAPYSEATPDISAFFLDAFDPRPIEVPPSTLETPPPPRPASLVDEPTADAPGADAPAPAPDATRFDVVLHFPNRVAVYDAEALAASAARAGFLIEKLRPAGFSISRTNIRYFHDQDRDAATRLAAAVDGEVRDFTNFRPPPAVGVIEIYMAGRGASPGSQGGLAEDLERLQRGIRQAIESLSGN